MALLLREQDVTELLDMPIALEAVEEVLKDQAEGLATNRPRQRVQTPASQMHVMIGGSRRLGVYGLKTYTWSREGLRFLVLLYEETGGDLLAVIEADRLSQIRTGAASGVATKYMARPDAETVGLFGTGWQAESQLMAVCAVRGIKSITAYSRKADRRNAFARKMSELLGIPVTPTESPEQAARGQAIIITATNAREPVLDGAWLEAGAHINAIGANALTEREIDLETITRAATIAVDSLEQARIESGELTHAVERGVRTWESVVELGRIVAGQVPGRRSEKDITLFKSLGITIEDIATGYRVYTLAKERGIGEEINFWRGQQ